MIIEKIDISKTDPVTAEFLRASKNIKTLNDFKGVMENIRLRFLASDFEFSKLFILGNAIRRFTVAEAPLEIPLDQYRELVSWMDINVLNDYMYSISNDAWHLYKRLLTSHYLGDGRLVLVTQDDELVYRDSIGGYETPIHLAEAVRLFVSCDTQSKLFVKQATVKTAELSVGRTEVVITPNDWDFILGCVNEAGNFRSARDEFDDFPDFESIDENCDWFPDFELANELADKKHAEYMASSPHIPLYNELVEKYGEKEAQNIERLRAPSYVTYEELAKKYGKDEADIIERLRHSC